MESCQIGVRRRLDDIADRVLGDRFDIPPRPSVVTDHITGTIPQRNQRGRYFAIDTRGLCQPERLAATAFVGRLIGPFFTATRYFK